MAEVKVPYAQPGVAAFEPLDEYTAGFLLSGSDPKLEPGYPLPVTADEVLEQFTVVALVNGKITKHVWDNGVTRPTGVVTDAVTGNSAGTTTVPVFFAGCFNPDALVWDASYDTMAKKLDAFFGAESPTRITMRERG